ncbi:type VI secretion system ATPase TssH [Stigmatella sp. ncwal1]|uniref:Type VI secretion system ATPase TssH n=1 Tax=Stigmatella ashevillensis TaxID=2995309 RepID=A0ABT5DCA5_9BACT|nr:type VI secretion system ATPase TssH [Stigmatella ashevillena]MDC0711156.1 type VI secretion system ATPase TssH [Stigmatella ashevillena]
MRVDPQALVKRLTPTATRHLEAAVGRASGSHCHEIVVEHLLAQLLALEDSEVVVLLRRFEVDPKQLAGRVERVLQDLRTGSAGRPVFSESVFQWLEDAWLLASVELGDSRLRSGLLVAQFILRRSRYTAEHFPELDAVPLDELKRSLPEVLRASAESQEAAPPAGRAASQGGAPEGADAGALKRFALSFTGRVREGKIDPVFGRHREIRQLVDILSRRRKNNPILVGEPGVGKTALVEGLAWAIVKGDVPEALRNVELMGLDIGLLQAGAGVRGEFENRLKAVIAEVKASATPIVLFIDEAHTLIGAGGAAGGSDAANLLKPALARGELRTIAATTWSEYKKYFEKDAALERRFQPVKVDEPGEEDAILMLRGLRPIYESAHGVTIRDEAITAAVRLSHRYIASRQLPDKAVDLLDTAAARVRIEQSTRPDKVSSLEAQIAGVERERDALRRDLAEAHSGSEEALEALEAKLRALRDSLAALKGRWETERSLVTSLQSARKNLMGPQPGQDTSGLRTAVGEAAAAVSRSQGEDPLVHADVDADVVARVVASWTGIPVGKMRSDALEAVLSLEERLGTRVRGQNAALQKVAETLRIAQAGIRNPDTPIGVLLFVGPSGVGKTETALALADALYGGERFMTTLNMSEFQEKHTVSRLIGSPPGYVGYGEGGLLTEAVRQRPYSVVLLDECEKAELEVMNLFYQVFDKGVLTDGEGRAVDFRNTVIILTSNLGTDLMMGMYERGAKPSTEEVIAAVRPTLSQHFKPALLARMTLVPFTPVGTDVMKEITRMKLAALAGRLRAAHRIETVFVPELVDELARRCTESETGARNVEHLLRNSLMPEISRELLQRLVGGDVPPRLSVGLAPDGQWQIHFTGAQA